MEHKRIDWNNDIVKEIQMLWRKSGYTLKKLQKQFPLQKNYLKRIIKNTKQRNDINKHGFRIVPVYKDKDNKRPNNYRSNNNYTKKPRYNKPDNKPEA
jgi:hypothetical protein